MNNSRGFSYVEILMSAAIFSMCIAPILYGFYISARNASYSEKYYKAGIYTNNLLVEAAAAPITAAPETLELSSFIGNGKFDKEYETERFSYRLTVYEFSGGYMNESFSLATSSELPAGTPPVFSGDTFSFAPDLSVAGNYLAEADNYMLYNDSPATRINIFTAPGVSLSSAAVFTSNGAVAVAVSPYERSNTLLLMVEMYDLESGNLLNKLTTLQ